MTTSPKLALAGFFALSAFSDVAPRCGDCGGRREPAIEMKQAGEECGWHGPRIRLDCTAPAQCMRVSGGQQVCSSACESDNDCAKLGAGFTCSSKGRTYDGQGAPETSICKRDATDGGGSRFAPPPPSAKGVDPG